MTNNHHNLLVLFYNGIFGKNASKAEMENLTAILVSIDSADHFCEANELVNRNGITSNRKKMLKEARHRNLRAFRFFINKN